MIRIELYDVARRRAGRDLLEVEARTLGEALRAAAALCPALAGDVVLDGEPSEHFRVSLNGDRFVSDPATPLGDGDSLLVLSAQAGG